MATTRARIVVGDKVGDFRAKVADETSVEISRPREMASPAARRRPLLEGKTVGIFLDFLFEVRPPVCPRL